MSKAMPRMSCWHCGLTYTDGIDAGNHEIATGHRVEWDDGGGITPEGQALGHRYIMGNVNAYCPKCSEEQGVTVLDCDYDLDK